MRFFERVLAIASLAMSLGGFARAAPKEANWLLTPPGGPFFYVVQLYLPATAARDGT